MSESTMHRPRTRQEWFFYDNSLRLLSLLIGGAYVYAVAALTFFIAAVSESSNMTAVFWGVTAVAWLTVARYHATQKNEIEGWVADEYQ